MIFLTSFFKKAPPTPKVKNVAQITRITKMWSIGSRPYLEMDIRALEECRKFLQTWISCGIFSSKGNGFFCGTTHRK